MFPVASSCRSHRQESQRVAWVILATKGQLYGTCILPISNADNKQESMSAFMKNESDAFSTSIVKIYSNAF